MERALTSSGRTQGVKDDREMHLGARERVESGEELNGDVAQHLVVELRLYNRLCRVGQNSVRSMSSESATRTSPLQVAQLQVADGLPTARSVSFC